MSDERADREVDGELEDRLRRHLRERLDGAVAPPFRATLVAAEARAAPRPRWRTGAWLVPAAAALLTLWVWWPQPDREDGLASQEVLLAELTSGTAWQAPSDRWLEPPQPPAYLGLPRLRTGRGVLDAPPLP